MRIHEYLTDAEVASLTDAAKAEPVRSPRLLTAYHHGFRVSELVGLRWDQIDFASTTLHVRRARRREASDARIAFYRLTMPRCFADARRSDPTGDLRAAMPHRVLPC